MISHNYFICNLYMNELSINDYKYILEFYKKPIPKSKRMLKQQAEKILSNKLCRCIKKINKNNESRAIGICTKNIINKKGYNRGIFTCKKKQTVKLTKKNNTRKIKNLV
jgi:hypothetical protein